eukprot:gnl/TRDRNA2_/TRDRNA2_59631_c0_seq1.p1 gnl/TRDRNA2_/TRDRNA2_59631_c0~~gnl/TRDRNA2_/TRDRNA2_59631_c0_seq1.p1  ORF type:complete len:140 (-),score=34.37 gnl/TRDRNA2_/TRDRNA2_59631_c0_seq1:437-856(-)
MFRAFLQNFDELAWERLAKALVAKPVLDARDDLVAKDIMVEVNGRRARTEPMVSFENLTGTGSTISLRYLDDDTVDVVEIAEVHVLPAVPSEIKEELMQAAFSGDCPRHQLLQLQSLVDGPFLTSYTQAASQIDGAAAA